MPPQDEVESGNWFGAIPYPHYLIIARILVQALEQQETPEHPPSLPAGRFARPGEVFAHGKAYNSISTGSAEGVIPSPHQRIFRGELWLKTCIQDNSELMRVAVFVEGHGQPIVHVAYDGSLWLGER